MAFRPRLKGYKFTPEKWAKWLARLNEQPTAGDMRRRDGITNMRARLVIAESRILDGMAQRKAEEDRRQLDLSGKRELTTGQSEQIRRAPGAASGRH